MSQFSEAGNRILELQSEWEQGLELAFEGEPWLQYRDRRVSEEFNQANTRLTRAITRFATTSGDNRLDRVKSDRDTLKVNGRYFSEICKVPSDLRALKVALDTRLALHGSRVLGSWKSQEEISDWVENAIANLEEAYRFFIAAEKRLDEEEAEVLDTLHEQSQAENDKEEGVWLDKQR